MRNKRSSITVSGAALAGLLAAAIVPHAIAVTENPLHPSFSRLDAGKKSTVTKDEFMSYMNSQWQILEKDTNPLHPNYLSSTEFTQADTNRDGKLTKEEFLKYEEAMWGKVDAAGKGQVTEAEYNRADNPLHPQHRKN
jgi:hypothetical protein